MVSTRSSNRLLKKAKLENDMVAEKVVNDGHDHDFQEPVILPRTRFPKRRMSALPTAKSPPSSSSTHHCAATSSAAVPELSADVKSEEQEEIDELTEAADEEVDQFTQEADEPSPLPDIAVSDTEDDSEPEPRVVRRRGRLPRIENVKKKKRVLLKLFYLRFFFFCVCVVQKNRSESHNSTP